MAMFQITRFDRFLLVGTPLATYLIARALNLHDHIQRQLVQWENWGLDELLLVSSSLSLALFAVLFRHVQSWHRVAMTDPLTSLPNRRAFLDLLDREQVHDSQHEHALLFLDLDGFKAINDQYGHRQGDRLLIETARRLRAAVPAHATVGRLGGDEFAVLLPGIGTAESAHAIAAAIAGILNQPYFGIAQPSGVSASIGIVLCGPTADDPLRDADLAMYAAKRGGKARTVVFQPSMRPHLVDHCTALQSLAG